VSGQRRSSAGARIQGYIGTVEAEDGVFFGGVIGLRDVITFEGTTFAEVEQAFRDSIDDYLAFCAERCCGPADRPYSGRIPLRVSPETHRRAAMRAQSEGLSLNQWIARRIESAV
jgi:predicted HicB family RNase H-like nuclease